MSSTMLVVLAINRSSNAIVSGLRSAPTAATRPPQRSDVVLSILDVEPCAAADQQLDDLVQA
jgi:hypothetical protein